MWQRCLGDEDVGTNALKKLVDSTGYANSPVRLVYEISAPKVQHSESPRGYDGTSVRYSPQVFERLVGGILASVEPGNFAIGIQYDNTDVLSHV